MQFLRTLFWVVLAVIAAIFSARNWTPVTIHLWGGIDADVKLPAILFAAFGIGFLPMFIVHRAMRWRLRRRLDTAERSLALAAVADPKAEIPEDSVIEPTPFPAAIPPVNA